MKFNLRKIGGVSLAILGGVFPAVQAVEDGFHAVKDAPNSKAKQDAALELIKNAQALALSIKDKSILDNPDVQEAIRAVIDATVKLHNILDRVMPVDEAQAPPPVTAPAAPPEVAGT